MLAGVLLLATVAHLFLVLPRAGFQLAMLDDRALLLPWVAEHRRTYGLLWLLYLGSLLLLLPVVAALTPVGARMSRLLPVAAALGLAGIVLGVVGTVVLWTTSPLVADAYVAARATGADTGAVLLVGDLVADTGKEVRLVADLLLGG